MKRGFVALTTMTGVLGSLVSLVTLMACSGADQTEFFGPDNQSQFGNDTSPTDPASSSGNPTTSSGNNGSSSSSGKSSTSSSSSSSSGSSGSTKDAGVDSSTQTTTVTCGKTTGVTTLCSLPNQVCCARDDLFNNDFQLTCETGVAGCSDGIPIGCDEKSDCPGSKVCCGTYDNNGYVEISCQATCQSAAGLSAARFCNPKAAVDECTAIGLKCGSSQTLPGFSVCK